MAIIMLKTIFIVFVIISVFFLKLISVFGFNFEYRDPLIKASSKKQKGSYFGFSVALHRTSENGDIDDSWMLVGAPLGQNLQPNSGRSGALLKCPISTSKNDCIQVVTDGQELEDYDQKTEKILSPPWSDEIKDGQWLGVSVKSQRAGGNVLVCAHRYIHNDSNLISGQGMCHLMESDFTFIETMRLCLHREIEKRHQQFGFCQVGTSISFVGDDFAIVGAPGPYSWRGTAFGKVIVENTNETIYLAPFRDVEKYSYLGMSVGGGTFFNKTEYFYIAGAPNSKLIGEVYFFKKHRNVEEFEVSLIITGEKFASKFGYEVLAVDVNNDGYDDLLVGAPFYYGNNKGGAVYTYHNLRNCSVSECKWDKGIYGKPYSRFGFSMTSLGDINKDGYNDVAIGAPYENDSGAIYVYLGSASGLNTEPSQVIRDQGVKPLGYSLSGGMDMDINGYPDLLVGAYESEKVLLFKARPIIDISIKIKSTELTNINATKKGCPADPNSNHTCFSFESCFTIGKINEGKVSVNYHIAEQKRRVSRVFFQDSRQPDQHSFEYQTVISVNNDTEEYCHKHLVKVRESVNDMLSPIKFKVNYTLDNERFHSPILNNTSVKIFEATFKKGCGNDDRCDSYLILKATADLPVVYLNESVYQLDKEKENFLLNTVITNRGEPAYEAKLYVFYPTALRYPKTKSNSEDAVHCSTVNDTFLLCDIGNPFPGEQPVHLKISFEIDTDTKENHLELKLLVNSTSVETSKETTQTVVAILHKLAKFQIKGTASSNVFYEDNVHEKTAVNHFEDIGARVTHKYQVDNDGLWDLTDLKVNIQWPLQVTLGEDRLVTPDKWLLYLESVPVISGVGIQGYCAVLNGYKVNELNLTNVNDSLLNDPENLNYPNESHEFVTSKDNLSHFKRTKRRLEDIVSTKITEIGGLERTNVVLDCFMGDVKCIDIFCTIRRLSKGNQATIEIVSRLWNSTLAEYYSQVDWVAIRSHAEVEIPNQSINMSSESITEFSAETTAYPTIITSGSMMKWWMVIGAVLAVLLLTVLVIILHRYGFFKRKQYDEQHMVFIDQNASEEDDV